FRRRAERAADRQQRQRQEVQEELQQVGAAHRLSRSATHARPIATGATAASTQAIGRRSTAMPAKAAAPKTSQRHWPAKVCPSRTAVASSRPAATAAIALTARCSQAISAKRS